MRLIVNGQEREIRSVATLADLLRELEIAAPNFAVAVNSQVVPKSRYEDTPVGEGDNIEIVHAVGGGL
ncbi:MAG: sulfur carrier protein ThiS [Nitrospinae bacterium]|nr:sulfur carrier protein ThiS [Nitrospinota bacterium]